MAHHIDYDKLEILWDDWGYVQKIHKLVIEMINNNQYHKTWNEYLHENYNLNITVKYGKYDACNIRYLHFENEIEMQLFVINFL